MLHQADGPSLDIPIGVYDLGFEFTVKIEWFPAIIEKFSRQHFEIAIRIRDEIHEVDSLDIWMHQFEFADEWIMIATSIDEEREVISIDADLVAYEEEVGTIQHDDEEKPVMTPIPASSMRNRIN